MDETKTHEALDALADLFLTGVEPREREAGADGGAVELPFEDDVFGDASQPVSTSGVTPPGPGGGRPVRLPPKASRGTGAVAENGSPRLRLTPAESARQRLETESLSAGDVLPIRTEAVFLGNLPGFGGPWLVQYAHALSRDRGPVAVLHVDGSGIDLELVGPRAEGGSPVTGDTSLVDLLRSLAHREELPVRTFLVHLSSVGSGSEMQRAADLCRWTLCTGADDAAVVGAYRLLKHLVELDPRGNAAGRRESFRVGLVVMGSDENRAHAATKKLNTTTGSFLRMPVELLGWQKQMAPVSLQVVGSFAHSPADSAGNGDLWSRLCRLFAELEAEDMASFEDGSDEVFEEMTEEEQGMASGAMRSQLEAELKEEQLAEPAPGAARSQASAVASEAAWAHGAGAAAGRGTGAGHPEQRAEPAMQSEGEPDLSAMLLRSIHGGLPLEARCPQHPKTELLLDQSGRLHLLRRHQSGAEGHAKALEELRAALVDLMQVRRWVDEHMQLLQLTQRQCRFDGSQQPVLHLFTDHAKCAVELIGRLGDTLKLHLLQPVSVGGQSTWYCTELN